jgi:hypothetical protein
MMKKSQVSFNIFNPFVPNVESILFLLLFPSLSPFSLNIYASIHTALNLCL